MNTTLYDAQFGKPDDTVIVLMGENRIYAIGDIAYRVHAKNNGTLNPFCRLNPVTWIDGAWRHSQLGKTIIANWSRKCTVIE